jgi:uncharacterized protein YpmB
MSKEFKIYSIAIGITIVIIIVCVIAFIFLKSKGSQTESQNESTDAAQDDRYELATPAASQLHLIIFNLI